MMQPVTAPRTLKEKQRQEREALILKAAEAVLLEKGYHEMSIDEIAANVGIAKGTVYLHFASKEDLVLALIERDMQKLLDIVEYNIAQETTPRGKLETIFQAIYHAFFDRNMRMSYLMNSSDELHRMFEEKKEWKRDKWERIQLLIRALLEEGKKDGEFDPDLPTSVMVSAFFSLLSQRSYERLVVEEQRKPDDVVQCLKGLYFKSIAASKGE
jgi:TetR/AcrR family transcriptional regulator, fatty acid metabolism regulator protein